MADFLGINSWMSSREKERVYRQNQSDDDRDSREKIEGRRMMCLHGSVLNSAEAKREREKRRQTDRRREKVKNCEWHGGAQEVVATPGLIGANYSSLSQSVSAWMNLFPLDAGHQRLNAELRNALPVLSTLVVSPQLMCTALDCVVTVYIYICRFVTPGPKNIYIYFIK